MVRRLSRALEVAALIAASALTPGCIFGPGDDPPPVVMDPLSVEGAATPSMKITLGASSFRDGASTFNALPDGASVEVEHGPQGGHHLSIGVRIEDPEMASWTNSSAPLFRVETSVTGAAGLVSRSIESYGTERKPDGIYAITVRGYVAAETSGDVTVSVRVERYDGSGWQLASQRFVAR